MLDIPHIIWYNYNIKNERKIPMNHGGLEIERKFLVFLPDEKDIPITEKWEITQTYLNRPDPDVQRRVRRIIINGSTTYYYTEKRRLTGITREENEHEITSAEYEKLLEEALDIPPVIKTRYIIIYNGQRFEMDVYPFSDKYATIELELENESQHINLPPYINVIKEVTGDQRYFNGALVTAGKFPEEF